MFRKIQRFQISPSINRLIQSRLSRVNTHTLHQRNIYILPTHSGLMLLLTLAVLLLGSINYQLNLGYALTFLLGSSALVSIYICHENLRGLTLNVNPVSPIFAQQSALLTVQLNNSSKRIRYSIGVDLQNANEWVWCDIPAWGSASVQIRTHPLARGRHFIPALSAQTYYPIGAFRTWTVWLAQEQIVVYPKPEDSPPPLPIAGAQDSASHALTRYGTSDELDGIRSFREGDSPKRILWRKATKTWLHDADDHLQIDTKNPTPPFAHNPYKGLWVRDNMPAQMQKLHLTLELTNIAGKEAQLSRLCAWILMCEQLGLDYSLNLGGNQLEPSNGNVHMRNCLEMLALY